VRWYEAERERAAGSGAVADGDHVETRADGGATERKPPHT
jgi:hypothetical protein